MGARAVVVGGGDGRVQAGERAAGGSDSDGDSNGRQAMASSDGEGEQTQGARERETGRWTRWLGRSWGRTGPFVRAGDVGGLDVVASGTLAMLSCCWRSCLGLAGPGFPQRCSQGDRGAGVASRRQPYLPGRDACQGPSQPSSPSSSSSSRPPARKRPDLAARKLTVAHLSPRRLDSHDSATGERPAAVLALPPTAPSCLLCRWPAGLPWSALGCCPRHARRRLASTLLLLLSGSHSCSMLPVSTPTPTPTSDAPSLCLFPPPARSSLVLRRIQDAVGGRPALQAPQRL